MRPKKIFPFGWAVPVSTVCQNNESGCTLSCSFLSASVHLVEGFIAPALESSLWGNWLKQVQLCCTFPSHTESQSLVSLHRLRRKQGCNLPVHAKQLWAILGSRHVKLCYIFKYLERSSSKAPVSAGAVRLNEIAVFFVKVLLGGRKRNQVVSCRGLCTDDVVLLCWLLSESVFLG